MKKMFRLLAVSLTALLFMAADLPANSARLIQITDLQKTAQLSKSKNLPILIMFSTEGCPYCELLKEDFLLPMIISGDYTDKILLRELHVSDTDQIIDFKGHKIDSYDFARKYVVKLFPTTIFIDSKGLELTPKIVGVTTPSLFGGRLDSAIDKAVELLRSK